MEGMSSPWPFLEMRFLVKTLLKQILNSVMVWLRFLSNFGILCSFHVKIAGHHGILFHVKHRPNHETVAKYLKVCIF